MNIKELMIGDWVWQLGCTKPAKVATVSESKIYTYWADGTKHSKDQYYFEPVQLTDAIFKMNGFKRGSDGDWYYLTTEEGEYLEYYVPHARIAIRNVISTIDRVFIKNVENVHELQNILRIAGLSQMADNFKVMEDEA